MSDRSVSAFSSPRPRPTRPFRGDANLILIAGIGGLVNFVGADVNASAYSMISLVLRACAALAAIVAGVGLRRGRRWGAAASVVWVVLQLTSMGVALASSIRELGMPHHSVAQWMIMASVSSLIVGSLVWMVARIWRGRAMLAPDPGAHA